MGKNNGQKGAYFFLGIVVLVWGANFGIVKSAYTDLPPLFFGALRFTASGVLLLGFALWREKGIGIRPQDFASIAIVGVLGLGFYQVLWSVGLDMTSATNSALILSVQPLLGAAYVDLTRAEVVEKSVYWSMLLAFAGVVLVIFKPTARLSFSTETLTGDLFTVAASFCSAVFFSARAKPLLETYSPVRLMGHCMILTAVVLWIASLLLSQPQSGTVRAHAWFSLAYAILFSGILGHVLWYVGIGRIGVTKSMVYWFLTPVCAVLFNAFAMGETILPQQILGGLLILLGVYRTIRIQ